MISAWWLAIIIPASVTIGFFLMALCYAARNGGNDDC